MYWGKALIGLAAVVGLAIPLCCCEAQSAPAAPSSPRQEQKDCCSGKETPKQHENCPCSSQNFRDAFAKTDAPRPALDPSPACKAFSQLPQWTAIQVWRPAETVFEPRISDPDLPARGSPRYLLLEIFRC
jgi:hypothetical protein